jgi:hypothetical protein
MFCFRCKTECRRGLVHCPECGSILVYRFPSPHWISKTDRKLVFLQRFESQFAAEVAKITLKAGGIESLLVRGDHGRNPQALSFEAGAEIFVRSEDVEDAKAILNGEPPERL